MVGEPCQEPYRINRIAIDDRIARGLKFERQHSAPSSLNRRIFRPRMDYGNHVSNPENRRFMDHTIRATDLTRSLLDVLSGARFGRESFVIIENGKANARVVQIGRTPADATVGVALAVWCRGSAADHAFAADLDAVSALDVFR